jgi:predicted nucleotidyltransferase
MKKFMYHLRGLLAAKYAALHGTYPPVLFNDLVDRMVDQENIKAEIANLVRLKKESREHNTMIVNESLVAFATGVATEIESMLGTFPEEKQMDYKKLDQFFLNILTTLDV